MISRVTTRTGQLISPIVIAHRGASGYLPEHSFAAKALAFAMGADYLEQDVVATRDDQLVVLHDIHLDRVADVAAQFPGRQRDDGRFYVRDFSLDEIRSLRVHERTNADARPVYPGRFQSEGEDFRIRTFAEELAFVELLQARIGTDVGVYPEIKRPAWHRSEGVDIAPLFLRDLADRGYTSREDRVFVQCFDDSELLRLREDLDCNLKLVQLIGDNSWGEADTDYSAMTTASGLRRLAQTVDGIGPWIDLVIKDPELVGRAHREGLVVHPYTFRRDDLPSGFDSFAELMRFGIDEAGIDGLFTDFPDLARAEIDS